MSSESEHKRLISLDAFRGMTIASMILVNSPGSYRAVYAQLKHAPWNGWTFTDTIFPFFLFIVGVSIVFAFARRKESGFDEPRMDLQIVKRTVILFALGLFMNSYPIFHLSTLRIPGVLQRTALCYFFASIIVRKYSVKDQVYWLLGLLASYWLMMRFVPVPGIGAGVLEPGNNLAAYVDSLFLGGHMFAQYETWDPEGLLSTIPALGTTLFGVLAGHWLRLPLSGNGKTAGMIFAGALLTVAGLMLDHWLPINKNIWTSTFSILMAGLALLTLAVFYWLIDVMGFKWWAMVFVIFGMNSIAIYVLSEILDTSLRFVLMKGAGSTLILRDYLHRSMFAQYASPENASLLYALSYVFLVFLIAWAMWKMKIFIKI